MGKVQTLPESLIRLIAAGEVIERPASVMKELVENSLDAGARRISADIWGAGRARIRVSDDGEGMTADDAERALERHATSKLKNFDDLYQLRTLGFGGEALPSIAAVSRLELTTCTDGAKAGTRLTLEGGKRLSREAAGVSRGTTIDVRDLFFNTPVRAKFLKKDGTERAQLVKVFEEIALAHPETRFELSFDGKPALALSAGKDLRERVTELWGEDVARNLTALDATRGPCRFKGFVSQATTHRPTKAYQALFVNGRPIQHRGLQYSLYEAYREWLPVGRHPAFALFIELDSKLVDVNVHPAKREVRFADERALQDAAYASVRSLFTSSSVSKPSFAAPTHPTLPSPSEIVMANILQSPIVSEGAAATPLTFAWPTELTSTETTGNLRFLGQYHKLYLLFDEGDALLLVDQHAADERVHYEKLLNDAAASSAARQPLLTPVLWQVSTAQAETMRSYLKEFAALGFILEAFGTNTFALKEYPAALPRLGQADRFLDELAEAFMNERPTNRTRVRHEIAARAACRAAIMAGDSVSPEEARRLVSELAKCERPMTCPHGRPSQIRFPVVDLNKRFGRP